MDTIPDGFPSSFLSPAIPFFEHPRRQTRPTTSHHKQIHVATPDACPPILEKRETKRSRTRRHATLSNPQLRQEIILSESASPLQLDVMVTVKAVCRRISEEHSGVKVEMKWKVERERDRRRRRMEKDGKRWENKKNGKIRGMGK